MKTKSNSKVYKILSGLNEIKWRVALKGVLSGVIAGLLVVLYRMGIEYGTDTALNIYVFLKVHPLMMIDCDAFWTSGKLYCRLCCMRNGGCLGKLLLQASY